jgi:glycosyltransferase involved in cell wall biosynthesis
VKVLALTPAPAQSAATRFRLLQLAPALAEAGIDLDVRPFLDGVAFAGLYDRARWKSTTARLVLAAARRTVDVARAQRYDVVLVQREAMLAGPPVVEAVTSLRRPMVLDLDDPTWVAYDSPTYGRFARVLKAPGKALWLIDHARAVTCGSTYVQRFVATRGRPATLVPTVADPGVFRPMARPETGDRIVVGWIGTHSTWPYLAAILPSIEEIGRRHPVTLRVVGAGVDVPAVPGVDIDQREWDLEREPADFATVDIGLYPITEDAWSVGKSGFKSVQYLACGVPFVVSPVGAAASIGTPGETHFVANGPGEWVEALDRLCGDAGLRRCLGEAGRRYSLEHHSVEQTAGALGAVLREVAG